MENTTLSPSYCDKMDGLARWLGTSVAAAFFASLERCSCINIDADRDDEPEDAHDRPLMFTRLHPVNSAANNQIGNAVTAPSAA